jgi:hypothetical protein
VLILLHTNAIIKLKKTKGQIMTDKIKNYIKIAKAQIKACNSRGNNCGLILCGFTEEEKQAFNNYFVKNKTLTHRYKGIINNSLSFEKIW